MGERNAGTGLRATTLAATFGAMLAAIPAMGETAQAADCGANAGPGVDWTDCRKRNLILDRSDLSAAVLDSADLAGSVKYTVDVAPCGR
jgi:hypothetical protein